METLDELIERLQNLRKQAKSDVIVQWCIDDLTPTNLDVNGAMLTKTKDGVPFVLVNLIGI